MRALRSVHPGALPRHRHETPERRVRRRAVQPADGSQRYQAKHLICGYSCKCSHLTPPGGQNQYSTGTSLLRLSFGENEYQHQTGNVVLLLSIRLCNGGVVAAIFIPWIQRTFELNQVSSRKHSRLKNIQIILKWGRNSELCLRLRLFSSSQDHFLVIILIFSAWF